MNKKIRIGNDIDITWSILDADEQPYLVEGRDIAVELNIGKKRVRITEFDLHANQIHFVYYGKDQKYLGSHNLKFIENEGEVDMVTFDTEDVFRLMEHSWLALDEGETPETVQLEVVTVSSELNSKIGPRGYSAYEVAVQNGFVGTEEEWLASLVGPAGPSPVITADEDGVIYSDGEVLTRVIKGIKDQSDVDHLRAGQDHDRAEEDHAAASSDHIQAGEDHTRAEEDHSAAEADHTQADTDHGVAASDHTRADSDHTAAAADHAQAGTDHARAENDHSRAEADHNAQIDQSARLAAIESRIPAQASQSNQLADKEFVNSSIATATATFRGTYNLVSDLGLTTAASAADIATALAAQSITPDANDYCFVQIPTADATPTEIARIDRYKHNGTAWAYEYSLNNSGFTADQWAAINSGITSAQVTAFNAKYDKPSAGIPETDLTPAVQDKLNFKEIFVAAYGVTTYAEVHAADMAGKFIVCNWAGDIFVPAANYAGLAYRFVQVEESIGTIYQTQLTSDGWSQSYYNIKIDIAAKYTKPANGIPASDIAAGVIPDVSGFITKSVDDLVNYYLKSDTYTKAEVQTLVDAVKQFTYEVVSELPVASASTMHKIYLAPSADPQQQNIKDEFITLDNGVEAQTRYTWEQIGSTAIDLSGYVTTTALNTALANYTTTADLTTLLAAKQDTLVSGTNIKTINNQPILGAGNLDVEVPANKVTSISAQSTDTEYPSAKCVYDIVGDIETLLAAI